MVANKMLFVLPCVLCIVSVYVISSLEFQDYLLTRIITVFAFLPFLFYYKIYKSSKLFAISLLFVVFEVLLYQVKTPMFSKIAITLRGITYFLIVASVYKSLKFNINKNIIVTVAFAIIISINSYMLYSLIQLVDDKLMSPTHRGIVIGTCMFIVMACVAAANYNFIKFSVKSTLFLIFIYCFALSDVTAFCGFYLEFDLLYYPDRFLALIGYPCFLLYASYSHRLRQKSNELKSVESL